GRRHCPVLLRRCPRHPLGEGRSRGFACPRTRRRGATDGALSLVRLLPDPVARRLVVADPEVPASARGRRERPVDGADAVRASGAQRVAPDELRVLAALLAGTAGLRSVVVCLHLAGTGG